MDKKSYGRRRVWRNRLMAILEIVMHLHGCPLTWPRCCKCWRLMAVPKEEENNPKVLRCVRCNVGEGNHTITFHVKEGLYSFQT